jgi:hypothetical protein
MDDQRETNAARNVPEIDVPSEAAAAPAAAPAYQAQAQPQPQPQFQAQPQAETQAQHAPYVRQRPAHRSVGTVSDYDDAGEAAPAQTAHDSGYTNRGSLMSGGAYRRSRSDAKKLRRDLHYGQYLEIPKGRRDIFVKRERATRIKTFLALVVVIAVLAIVVYFLWHFMQTNWGSTS